MKDQPEIAPELRGLLEEIAADPRSSMRLVPRRALRRWFESGEVLRVGDVEGTNAERHLIAAHREELAELLRKASEIAYWKAPVLTHRPIGADGKPYNPAEAEPEWREKAEHELRLSGTEGEGLGLLRECLEGVQHDNAVHLAEASLTLVPCDRTRCYLSLAVPWNQPRSAILFLTRLCTRPRPASLRPGILLSLAARLCAADRYQEARDAYRSSEGICGRSYAFNLSCLLGDEKAAVADATELGKLAGKNDAAVLEARRVLGQWKKLARARDVSSAAQVALRIGDAIPAAAQDLCEVFTS